MPIALRIATRTAISQCNVQVTIWAESHPAAVVIFIRLLHIQHWLLALWVCAIRFGRDLKTGNSRIQYPISLVSIIYVKISILSICRVER